MFIPKTKNNLFTFSSLVIALPICANRLRSTSPHLLPIVQTDHLVFIHSKGKCFPRERNIKRDFFSVLKTHTFPFIRVAYFSFTIHSVGGG